MLLLPGLELGLYPLELLWIFRRGGALPLPVVVLVHILGMVWMHTALSSCLKHRDVVVVVVACEQLAVLQQRVVVVVFPWLSVVVACQHLAVQQQCGISCWPLSPCNSLASSSCFSPPASRERKKKKKKKKKKEKKEDGERTESV